MKPNVVILNREELFMFFGEMALPPWEHSDGTMCGDDVDCAPIASKIETWVNEHEQKTPVLAYATLEDLLTELNKRGDVEPRLGYATTQQLIDELLGRAEVGGYKESVIILLTAIPYQGITVGQLLELLTSHAKDPNHDYANYRTVDEE